MMKRVSTSTSPRQLSSSSSGQGEAQLQSSPPRRRLSAPPREATDLSFETKKNKAQQVVEVANRNQKRASSSAASKQPMRQQSQSQQRQQNRNFSSFTEEIVLIASPFSRRGISNRPITARSIGVVTQTAKQKREDEEKLAHLQKLSTTNNKTSTSSSKGNKDYRTDLRRLELEEQDPNKHNMRHVFAPFVMLLPEQSKSNNNEDDDDIFIQTPTPMKRKEAFKNKSTIMSGKRRQRDKNEDESEKQNVIDVDAFSEDEDGSDDKNRNQNSKSKSHHEKKTTPQSIFSSILPETVGIFCRCPSTCVDLVPRKKKQQRLDQLPQFNVADIDEQLHHENLHKHKMIPHPVPLPCQSRITCSFCSRQAPANLSANRLAREWLQCPETGCCCTKPPNCWFVTNNNDNNKTDDVDAENDSNDKQSAHHVVEGESIGGLRKSLCRQCVMDILDDPRYYRSVEDWRQVRRLMVMMIERNEAENVVS